MTLDVLLPLKFDHPFTYNVPKEISVKVGDFVLVPFQNKDIIGVVWGKSSPIKSSIKIKDIKKKFDFVSLSKDTLIFLEKFSRYNLVDLGIALKLFIFKKAFKELSKKIKQKESFEEYSLKKYISFDASQKKAIKILDEQIAFDKFSTVLLHGITGSGKTLIYFKKIQDFLEKGYQVLVLLPEIALTNQIKERFKEYFGNYPSLWHSDISEKDNVSMTLSELLKLAYGSKKMVYRDFVWNTTRGIIETVKILNYDKELGFVLKYTKQQPQKVDNNEPTNVKKKVSTRSIITKESEKIINEDLLYFIVKRIQNGTVSKEDKEAFAERIKMKLKIKKITVNDKMKIFEKYDEIFEVVKNNKQ